MTRAEGLVRQIQSVPVWFHSIELADGIVTPGLKDQAHLRAELDGLRLPDLHGKSVLDIGAWDGFYSFEAERRGASRVVAMDHFVWSLDLEGWMQERSRLHSQGEMIPPAETLPGIWRPDEMPGKRGFDVAREALASGVEPLVCDLMELDPGVLGEFDVVLFLGVLYHMRDPLGALERVASLTREVAVIETEAIEVPGVEGALCAFFPGDELDSDPTNWWVPNAAALEGMCRAAGFQSVDLLPLASPEPHAEGDPLRRLRLAAQARR